MSDYSVFKVQHFDRIDKCRSLWEGTNMFLHIPPEKSADFVPCFSKLFKIFTQIISGSLDGFADSTLGHTFSSGNIGLADLA